MRMFLVLALSVASASSALAQISFQPALNVPVGVQPDAAVIFDLDEDGDLDIAVASGAPDKVGILLNNGSGVFAAPINVFLTNGSSPHTPVAGDLDGDGDADLAVSLQSFNAVQLIVNGGGTFTAGASFSVGLEPRDLVIENLDNDGRLDLVSANRTGNTVSVMRNMGGLTFAVFSFPAGFEPRDLAVGDLTGDGRIDVAVAAHASNQIVVLRNAGAAVLTQHATLSLGALSPDGVTIARLDGNASLDIAASAASSNVHFVSVFLNQGTGTFTGPTSFATNGQGSRALVAANLDGDADVDVATANADGNNVSTLANNGASSFGAAQLVGVGLDPNHIAAGDLNGDGPVDLVVTNEASNSISVLINANAADPCSVEPYCAAKPNSAGGLAQLSSSGTPSVSSANFSVVVSNALPTQTGILFYSNNGPAAFSLLGGMVCVDTPLVRLAVQQTSATGAAQFAIPVVAGMVGDTRWFQFFYRDPANPDGSGAGLSNALAVSFCN